MRGARDQEDPLDVATILEHHGAGWVASGSGWRNTVCPYHPDRNASGSVNRDIGVFVCHACGVKGNAVQLIMRRDDIGWADAQQEYTRITGRSAGDVSKRHARKSSRPLSVRSEDYEAGSGLFGPRLRRR